MIHNIDAHLQGIKMAQYYSSESGGGGGVNIITSSFSKSEVLDTHLLVRVYMYYAYFLHG